MRQNVAYNIQDRCSQIIAQFLICLNQILKLLHTWSIWHEMFSLRDSINVRSRLLLARHTNKNQIRVQLDTNINTIAVFRHAPSTYLWSQYRGFLTLVKQTSLMTIQAEYFTSHLHHIKITKLVNMTIAVPTLTNTFNPTQSANIGKKNQKRPGSLPLSCFF